MRGLKIVISGLLLMVSGTVMAAAPQNMNFQGRLSDSLGNPITGTKSVTFSIWNAPTTGTQLWTETQSVSVSTGIYNTTLGSVLVLSTGVFASTATWLQIQVAPDAAMTPRLQLQAVPYAFTAGIAASLSPSASIDLANPDGLAGLTPVIQRISLTSPYTVPTGMNFHLINVATGTQACGAYGMCDLTATGGGNLLHNGVFWARYNLNILGPGTVLASTSSAITFDIVGFTVPATVQTITANIAPGSGYTVPGGVNMYLLSIGSPINTNWSYPWLTVGGVNVGVDVASPVIIGSGQTISNPAGGVTATINGYFK